MPRTKKVTEVDDTLKFVWAYLILNGKITNGEWSYYGSCWENAGERYKSWDEVMREREELRNAVSTVGIDWTRTEVPEIQNEMGFNGTDSESSYIKATLGKLVLNNGAEYLLGSSDDEAAGLARVAQEMLRKPGESEVEKLAKTL